MTRPLRILFENAVYHVTCRGNAKQDIFADDRDRRAFISLLQRSSEIYRVSIAAFVLMNNHFHLLVRTPRANLHDFMRHFNISYTAAFNKRHDRTGHLYQGRYKSFLIDADSYLLEVSRYIHLNPVRSRNWESPEERNRHIRKYEWSSYPSYISKREHYPFLATEDVLHIFNADLSAARQSYRSFVEKSLISSTPNPLEMGRGHGIVGSQHFLEKINGVLKSRKKKSRREVPQARRVMVQIQPNIILEKISSFYGIPENIILDKKTRGEVRPVLMELLYRYGGMNGREIGELLGVDYSTVSVTRKRLMEAIERDKKLRKAFLALEDALSIQE